MTNEGKRRCRALFMCVTALFMLLMLRAVPARAAVAIRQLKAGTTYTGYDFTKDGKKDKIRYTMTDNSYYLRNGIHETRLYLNGRKVASIRSSRGGIYYFCKFNSRNVFLICKTHYAGGANDFRVYAYQGGKVKCVNKDLENGVGFYLNNTFKASGDKLVIESYPKFFASNGAFRYLNPEDFTVRSYFTLKSGVPKLHTRNTTVKKSINLYANKAIRTAASISKPSKMNGPTIQKGKTFKITHIYFNSKGIQYYQASVGGRTGWFKESSGLILRKR